MPLPEAASADESAALRQQLSKQGIVKSGASVVESVASDPADLTLVGQFRFGPDLDRLLSTELNELADGPLQTQALFRRGDEPFSDAGYYSLESANVEPVHQNARDVFRYDLSLSFVGTRSTQRREIATTRREIKHPFGNGTTAPIGVPAVARDVRWLNPSTDATEPASPTTTKTTAFGDIDIYELTTAPFSDASLVYDIAKAEEGKTDLSVFDTRGRADKVDADGIRRWQKVFAASHEFRGNEAVISNGLIRARFDLDASPAITVEQYDAGADAWQSISLGASDWALVEFDIAERQDQRLGTARVDVWTRWRDSASGTEQRLDLSLQRGRESLLFARLPEQDAPVPSGLADLLAPVADSRVIDPQPVRALRPREAIQ